MSEENPNIRIKYLSDLMHQQVTNIARNKGIPVGDFLKPHFRKLVEKFSEELKKEFPDKKHTKEITVYGASKSVANDLDNICNNINVAQNNLIKIYLQEVIDSYPDHLKRTPNKN